MCAIYLDPMHPQAPPIPRTHPQHGPSNFCVLSLVLVIQEYNSFFFFNPMKNIKLVIRHAFALTIQLYEMCPHCWDSDRQNLALGKPKTLF